MNVGLLLVTHAGIGEAIARTASAIVEAGPRRIRCLDVPFDADPRGVLSRGAGLMAEIDAGAGVLVLADCPGATPANVARDLVRGRRDAAVVTGLNLPMLLRLLNSTGGSLDEACRRAVAGGREAILAVPGVDEA